MDRKPLTELEESWVFGMLWPKRLLIFEDRIELHDQELLRETVETTEYSEVEGVVVGGGVRSTNLLIRRRRDKPILMRGVDGDAAVQAKQQVEERMTRFAAGHSHPPRGTTEAAEPRELLRKLAELRDAGVLTGQEFDAKKKIGEGEL